MKNAKRPSLTEPPLQTLSTFFVIFAGICRHALQFRLLYCTIAPMTLSNFDRFAALLSPQQLQAMGRVCDALQEDPTCLDTHRAGFVPVADPPHEGAGKETSDGF